MPREAVFVALVTKKLTASVVCQADKCATGVNDRERQFQLVCLLARRERGVMKWQRG